jgi:hypothetical protein
LRRATLYECVKDFKGCDLGVGVKHNRVVLHFGVVTGMQNNRLVANVTHCRHIRDDAITLRILSDYEITMRDGISRLVKLQAVTELHF